MKIELTETYGFRAALRGMRNPMNSWKLSDSKFGPEGLAAWQSQGKSPPPTAMEIPYIGPADLKLCGTLIRAGGDHRKFMRQIIIWVDVSVPIDVWSELDTYKVATVRNSCSTMHKLGSRDLEPVDFEKCVIFPSTLLSLNIMGKAYREKGVFIDPNTGQDYSGVTLLEYMKHNLPSGFIQKATYMMSYETAFKMYFSRRHHRLPQWSGKDGITDWIRSLPYMEEFISVEDGG